MDTTIDAKTIAMVDQYLAGARDQLDAAVQALKKVLESTTQPETEIASLAVALQQICLTEFEWLGESSSLDNIISTYVAACWKLAQQ
jgi:hypothetical protein